MYSPENRKNCQLLRCDGFRKDRKSADVGKYFCRDYYEIIVVIIIVIKVPVKTYCVGTSPKIVIA